MTKCGVILCVLGLVGLGGVALAQNAPPLVNWTAPPYWAPTAGQHGARAQALSAQASFLDRDVSAAATPETPLTGSLPFVAITPCRLVDTRHGPKDVQQPGGGTLGFPRGQYASGETRSYDLTSSADCTGLPAGVGAWSLQFQFTTATQPAYLEAWPYDSGLGVGFQSAPAGESTMLGYTDRWTANSAIIPAGNDAKGSINVYVQNAGDVIIEVNGFYKPSNIVTTLNTFTGDLTLAHGSNVTITPSGGNTLTIDAPLTVGPTGPTGAQGVQGATGAAGVCAGGMTSLGGGTAGWVVPPGTAEYTSLVANLRPSNSDTTNGNARVYCVGSLSNFSVTLSSDTSPGYYIVTVMVNGVASALSCNASSTCTSAGPIILNAGDTVNVRINPNQQLVSPRSATWTSSFTIPSSGGPVQ
ncbi:MAG: hypothetical protein ACHQQS_03405 [Thermoanaerobaculales bacterium]